MGLDETARLLHDAQGGNEHSRGELLERLRPRLVLWAATRLSPALRAKLEPEDIAQEILLMVHRDWAGFSGSDERAFFGWVFRIAENRIRDIADHFGAVKRQTPERFSFSQTSPSAAAARSELCVKVHQALARLPEDYRQVIQLRRLEDREVPEVAQIMTRSENAVRVLYCRALRELRRAMEAPAGGQSRPVLHP